MGSRRGSQYPVQSALQGDTIVFGWKAHSIVLEPKTMETDPFGRHPENSKISYLKENLNQYRCQDDF